MAISTISAELLVALQRHWFNQPSWVLGRAIMLPTPKWFFIALMVFSHVILTSTTSRFGFSRPFDDIPI
jgi:hypothetical protein